MSAVLVGGGQALEASLRESDGGHLPKGWPDRYEPVFGAVLAVLEPGELVQRAWRIRNPRTRQTGDLGLLLVTDRRVLGADRSSEDSGRFAVAVSDVATVALVRLGIESPPGNFITTGWKISLRAEDGAVLGGQDSPAEFQVFTRGKDPSHWDIHVRGEEELRKVQFSLVELLPGARAFTDKSTTALGSEYRLTLSDTKVQPGGELRVTCSVRPWPNEKLESVYLELGYDAEVASMERVPATSLAGMFVDKWEMHFNKRHMCVGDLAMARDELEPTGTCVVTFVVPPDGPPSSVRCGTTSWSVMGTFARRALLFSSEVARSSLEVGSLTAEQIRSARPADWGPVGPSWFTLETTEPQHLSISLDTPTTARGDVLRGKLVFKLDPLGAAERGSYWTDRGKQKELAKVAKADVTEVAMNDAVLTLECWRCCPPLPPKAVGTNQLLLFTQDATMRLPPSLEVGKVHEFPFSVAVPGAFEFEDGARPASPTWYARRESGISVEGEDFLWRLSAIVRTSPKQFPLRAATEVLIT